MAMVVQVELPEGLPFQVGDEVELKSFLKGYRGAWFRCKITKLRKMRGSLQCAMQYCDYPDEKIIWTSLYEAAPIQIQLSGSAAPTLKGSSPLPIKRNSLRRQRTKELMLRPPFPPFHQDDDKDGDHRPLPSSSSEVTVVLNNSWRFGDLVDLWCDGCFWSGNIINLQSDGAVEVRLPGPPIGEGGVYKGLIADLRPSINWSQENGWSVPLSQVNGDSWYTARLVQCSPLAVLHHDSDQSEAHVGNALDPSCILCVDARNESLMSLNAAPIMSLEWSESTCLAIGHGLPSTSTDMSNSDHRTVRFPRNKSTNEKSRAILSSDEETGSERSRGLANDVGSADGASTEKSMSDLLRFGRKHNSQKSRKVVCSEDEEEVSAVRNSERDGDAIETKIEIDIGESIMELEEVANKIRWLKGLLRFGYSSWLNRPSSTWKFLTEANHAHPNSDPDSKAKQ